MPGEAKVIPRTVVRNIGDRAVPAFPFLDLKAQFANIRDEVLVAITRVMESQHFILGPEVEALERDLSNHLGSQHAIACASGSDALLLALMALGVGPGDEVITVPFTFVASVACIVRVNAKPVFVDIVPETYNIDPAQIEGAISRHTKAILPVHLFGLSVDMDPIMDIGKRHGIPVIEDAAQAIGSRYRDKMVGTMGNLGCFSFFPSKNLGGAGDGGLLTTNDSELADRLRILRVHGSRKKYQYELLGINSRLDALQAAILRVKLQHLEEWTQERERNAGRYESLFKEYGLEEHVRLPHVPSGYRHVYNQYVLRVDHRDALRDYLKRAGIPTEVYYPHALHLEQAFSYLGHKAGDLPHTELACQQVMALPIYPELSEEQQRYVVEMIADFHEGK